MDAYISVLAFAFGLCFVSYARQLGNLQYSIYLHGKISPTIETESRLKFFTISGIIMLGLAIFLLVTCPDKASHGF